VSDPSSLTTEVDPLILPLAEQILRRPGGVVAGGWRRRLGRVSGLGRRVRRFACGVRMMERSHSRVPLCQRLDVGNAPGGWDCGPSDCRARQGRPRTRITSSAVGAFRRRCHEKIRPGRPLPRRSPLSRKLCRFGEPRRRAATAENGSTLPGLRSGNSNVLAGSGGLICERRRKNQPGLTRPHPMRHGRSGSARHGRRRSANRILAVTYPPNAKPCHSQHARRNE